MEFIATLDIVGLQEDRETFPYRGDSKTGLAFQDVAIGETKRRVLVRGPSGRLYALPAPIELMDELRKMLEETSDKNV